MNIISKSNHVIEKIRIAGQYHNELLMMLYQYIAPGQTLKDIEDVAMRYIKKHNLIAAFHGFNGYPAYICTSLNDCVVHGIPDRTVLKPGDLLKVDLGINYLGGISDAAFSVVVGGPETNPEAQHMIDTSKNALDAGMKLVKAGNFISHYSEAVADHVRENHFSVIKTLT